MHRHRGTFFKKTSAATIAVIITEKPYYNNYSNYYPYYIITAEYSVIIATMVIVTRITTIIHILTPLFISASTIVTFARIAAVFDKEKDYQNDKPKYCAAIL